MKLLRLDTNKDMNQPVERIQIEANGIKFTITEECGRLVLHCHGGRIMVYPMVANEIAVIGEDD